MPTINTHSSPLTRMIVDVSSVIWSGLLAGKDAEFGKTVEFNGKQVNVNSAEYGYENAVNHTLAAMKNFDLQPSQLLFVVEGPNSKTLRRSMLPTYKEDRDTRPPEAYEEFNKCKEMLVNAFRNVGATSCNQGGLESDDVIAYLCKELEGRRIILSADKDLSVLLDENVSLYRQGVHHVFGAENANPWGPFSNRFITLMKATVGGKDGIVGARGFGEKAWLDLLCIFGEPGLEALQELIVGNRIGELAEDVPELKALQKIIDSADVVKQSWAAAKIYPELVNTLRMPLQWNPGMVKPLAECSDERLQPYAGRIRLVHADNYEAAAKWAIPLLKVSPAVSLDIETSTPPESDEWLKNTKAGEDERGIGVDVFGSELTGGSITFGLNGQYTLYFTVDHVEEMGLRNVTSDQFRRVVAEIPSTIPLVIQNVSFELPILYMAWGADQADNGYHGFLPNAYDTKILSSYENENRSNGLKQNSSLLLGYEQVTYDEVTTKVGVKGTLPNGGTLVSEEDYGEGLTQETRQYKMNELTAMEVLAYGADDTICTLALYNYYRVILEIEKTFRVYEEVEIIPAYLTALAFVKGTSFSMGRMKELEADDDKQYDAAWETMRNFLMASGWEGTVCPVFPELTPANIKEAYLIVTGQELKTGVRLLAKLAAEIEKLDTPPTDLLAHYVATNNVEEVNKLIATYFGGEPVLDVGSPKKMQMFLYDTLNLPVRIINKVTPAEREKKPALAKACQKFNKIYQGSVGLEMLPEELEMLKAKATTDDTAIDFALAYDPDPERDLILNAFKTMKTITTRRGLYYKPYAGIRHWKDGRIHAQLNQCAAVTRRYSSSKPNLQQLPKKGEGVKFRECFVPHKPNAVVMSCDFAGQELRLMAGQSLDKNMMDCYVGDNLKDIHSITASGAMRKKWGAEVVEQLFSEYGPNLAGDDVEYDLFMILRKAPLLKKKADDLRKDGKEVNFAAQFDCRAPKLAHMLVIDVPDAQMFLEAKYTKFPRVETWKDEVRRDLMRTGYCTTLMGARRHLAHAVRDNDKWKAEAAGRQGPNFKVQGSAAEQTKLAMRRLWESDVLFTHDAEFIAPIHDELTVSVTYPDALEVVRVVNDAMAQPYGGMPLPFLGSISLGPTLGKQIECGDWFIPENVEAALREVQGIPERKAA